MDEKHTELKRKVDELYDTIKTSNDELTRIREIECKHPETEFVDYTTRPGQVWENTEICSVCGEVMKFSIEFPSHTWGKVESYDDGGCSTGLNED